MKAYQKIGIALLAILLAGLGVFLYLRMTDPLGSGSTEKIPVDIKGGTKIYWNDKNITKMLRTDISLEGVVIETEDPADINIEPNRPPQDWLSRGYLNPETLVDGQPTVGTKMVWLWTGEGEAYTYGQNGKSVAKIGFTGLEDDELVALLPEGIIYEYKKAGERTIYFDLVDSRGVQNNYAYYVATVGEAKP